MPAAGGFRKMRDGFIRDGLTDRIAKAKKTPRIYNAKSPKVPIVGATDNRDNRNNRDNRGGVE